MLKIRLIILLLFALSVSSFAQDDIDFAPRALMKALNIENVNELNELPELGGMNHENGKFYSIDNSHQGSAFVYIGRVHSCRAGGCSASADLAMGFEYFDYFILFNKNYQIQQVKVYNYQATKGHEITAKNWLKQFTGYKGEVSLQVGKDIDTISGATVSVYALTSDVESRTLMLRRYEEN